MLTQPHQFPFRNIPPSCEVNSAGFSLGGRQTWQLTPRYAAAADPAQEGAANRQRPFDVDLLSPTAEVLHRFCSIRKDGQSRDQVARYCVASSPGGRTFRAPIERRSITSTARRHAQGSRQVGAGAGRRSELAWPGSACRSMGTVSCATDRVDTSLRHDPRHFAGSRRCDEPHRPRSRTERRDDRCDPFIEGTIARGEVCAPQPLGRIRVRMKGRRVRS